MKPDTIESLKKAHAKLECPFSFGYDEAGGYVKDARGEFSTGLLPSGEPDIPMAEFLAGSLTYLPEIIDKLEATEAKLRVAVEALELIKSIYENHPLANTYETTALEDVLYNPARDAVAKLKQ